MAREGVPLNVIQRQLGHMPTSASPASTSKESTAQRSSTPSTADPHPRSPQAQAYALTEAVRRRHGKVAAVRDPRVVIGVDFVPARQYDRTVVEFTPRDFRAAKLANVLARAVREGEIEVSDARRVLRHELRRRNTNASLRIERRSQAAPASIHKYSPAAPPKNGSPDALHADHVNTFSTERLTAITTLEGWIAELEHLREVVCVTAAENYVLEKLERSGITGPDKYAAAGITFAAPSDRRHPTRPKRVSSKAEGRSLAGGRIAEPFAK
jgi:hypothetical protein